MSEGVVNGLGLRIYGGPLAVGLKRTALVSVGAAPEKFRPAPPTIVDEPISWMLVHAQDYTLYSQYSRDFETADGEQAQLLICLFLPADKRIGGGKSPLALLASLHDNFAVIGAPDGKLPQEELDNSPFRQLLGRYSLEPRPLPLPVMSGAEPAALRAQSQSQLDALMRHSRYASLLTVGRLEIGYRCPNTVALTDDVPDPEPIPEPVLEPVEGKPVIPSEAPVIPSAPPVIPSEAKESIPEPAPSPAHAPAPASDPFVAAAPQNDSAVIPSAPPVIPSEAKESIKAPSPAPEPPPVPAHINHSSFTAVNYIAAALFLIVSILCILPNLEINQIYDILTIPIEDSPIGLERIYLPNFLGNLLSAAAFFLLFIQAKNHEVRIGTTFLAATYLFSMVIELFSSPIYEKLPIGFGYFLSSALLLVLMFWYSVIFSGADEKKMRPWYACLLMPLLISLICNPCSYYINHTGSFYSLYEAGASNLWFFWWAGMSNIYLIIQLFVAIALVRLCFSSAYGGWNDNPIEPLKFKIFNRFFLLPFGIALVLILSNLILLTALW